MGNVRVADSVSTQVSHTGLPHRSERRGEAERWAFSLGLSIRLGWGVPSGADGGEGQLSAGPQRSSQPQLSANPVNGPFGDR